MIMNTGSIRSLAPIVSIYLFGVGIPVFHSQAGPEFPVGNWQVSFVNGVVETVAIRADRTVSVEEHARSAAGKITKRRDNSFELRFEDDRVEIWSSHGSPGRFSVQHWHPVSAMDVDVPAVGSALPSGTPRPGLEVHEWGTFTAVQGSDGRIVEWYQSPDKLVDLPPFVRRPVFAMTKSGLAIGQMDTIRMETPVLYFYPEKEMDITVKASFPQGRITEVFPPATKVASPSEVIWQGSLLPPNSKQRSEIPIAPGEKGRHYAAARNVPDAWLFRSHLLPLANLPAETRKPPNTNEEAVEPVDHFIFYRGAGQHRFYQLRAIQEKGSDRFTLFNHGNGPIPKIFALRVADSGASMLSIDQLPVIRYENGKMINQKTITLPKSTQPVSQTAEALREAMIESLHTEGLTLAEATAMVNTWDKLWFTEPGIRLLAVLPNSFADEMVPLSISPQPEKIARVFVGRVEILSRKTEERLTSLINPEKRTAGEDDDLRADARELSGLQLGRYAAGGMERALMILEQQFRSRFAELSRAAEEAK